MAVTPHDSGDRQLLRRELEDLDSRTLRWAMDVARLLRDPALPAITFVVILVGVSLSVLLWSGYTMTSHAYVSLQLPYLVSGGFGGLGLLGLAVVTATVLGIRRDQRAEDEDLDRLGRQVKGLVRAVLNPPAPRRDEEA